MEMGMIIHEESSGDNIAQFNLSDTEQLEAYLREICRRLGVEYGSEPLWDSYHWDTGGDYFEDVFTSKKGIFVVPFTTNIGESIYVFDNLFELLNEVENLFVSNDVVNGGVYSFPTMDKACDYIKDLKEN